MLLRQISVRPTGAVMLQVRLYGAGGTATAKSPRACTVLSDTVLAIAYSRSLVQTCKTQLDWMAWGMTVIPRCM